MNKVSRLYRIQGQDWFQEAWWEHSLKWWILWCDRQSFDAEIQITFLLEIVFRQGINLKSKAFYILSNLMKTQFIVFKPHQLHHQQSIQQSLSLLLRFLLFSLNSEFETKFKYIKYCLFKFERSKYKVILRTNNTFHKYFKFLLISYHCQKINKGLFFPKYLSHSSLCSNLRFFK